MDSLSSLSTFVQAAETRSFTQAGRMLGVSSSAIGKTIARLEAHLDVRLFHRSTRSISLTPEGEVLLASCRRILLEMGDVERELAGSRATPRGRLRVSLPWLDDLLGSALAAFANQYPEIELDLDFSDRLVDIVNEGFDVAIRTGEGEDSRLMSRRLGSYRLVLVGSPSYFHKKGAPQLPEDLQNHSCLHHRFPTTSKLERWPLKVFNSASEPPLPVALCSSTLEPLIRFAELGVGITCVPDFAIAQHVADGRLEKVLESFIDHENVFRIVWPSSKLIVPRLRVFLDFMTANLFKSLEK